MVALEVCELGRIPGLNQGLKAGLHQLHQAAAKHGLLAEQVFLGLFLEGGLDDAGAGAADAPCVRKRNVPGVASGVLVHADQVGHARAFGVLAAHYVTRALGGAHDDVDVLGRRYVAVVDVEAVGEGQRVPRLEVRGDELLVHLGLELVGNQDHDEVGLFRSGGHVGHLEPRLLGGLDGLGPLAQPDAHVASGVLQVQRMGVALASVADDGDLLVLDYLGVAVLFVVDGNGHCWVFLSL